MVQYRLVERVDDYALVELRGELAGQVWTSSLRQALEDHFVDDGVVRIRLDLAPVTFMDNYGVATLVALHRESKERGKRLLIEHAAGQVQEKLTVTGVIRILQEGD